MRAQAIQQLAAGIGLVAWGLLLVIAGLGRRISVLNFRWEGRQPQVRRVAARATLIIGLLALGVGGVLIIGSLFI